MKILKKFKIATSYILILSLITMMLLYVCPVNASEFTSTKLDDTLIEQLDNMSAKDKVDVSVWIKDIDYSAVEKETSNRLKKYHNFNSEEIELLNTTFSEEKLSEKTIAKMKKVDSNISVDDSETAIEEKRNIAVDMYEDKNENFLNSISCNENDVIYECKYAPNIILSLDKTQIYALCENPNVTDIYYYDKEAESLLNEQNFDMTLNSLSSTSTYNFTTEQYDVTGISEMRDTFGFTGSGIKIGIIDYPFANSSEIDYFNDDTFVLYYCSSNAITDSYSSHGNRVSCIIAGNYSNSSTGDTFVGAVPDAKLYATAGIDFRSALEVLLDNGVNVINSSLIFGSDGNNNYGDTAKWIDHIVSQHNVTYVGAAGNSGENGVGSGQMGYNSIAVGCCNNNGTLAGFSSYTNTDGKNYKPDLVAPGVSFVLPATRDSSTQIPNASSGTSFSSPMVTGAVAQLCQASSSLKLNPRLMKAVLLAGTKITDSMNEDEVITQSDGNIALSKLYGSGMLNVINSYALYSARKNYSSGSIASTTNTVTKTMSINASSGKLVRVCAVWDKPNTVSDSHSSGTITSPNIDTFMLKVTAPNGSSYTSYYAYDNKSIVSFVSSGSGNYTIQLIRQGAAVSDSVRYGLAASVQNS